MNNRCGCEDGMNCTRTSVCALEAAIEDATNQCEALLEDQLGAYQAVAEAAIVWRNAVASSHHGPVPAGSIKKKLKNLDDEIDVFIEWEQDL